MVITEIRFTGSRLPPIAVLNQLASCHSGRLSAQLFPPMPDLRFDIVGRRRADAPPGGQRTVNIERLDDIGIEQR